MEKIKDKSFCISFVLWVIINISGIQNIYFSTGNQYIMSICKVLQLPFIYVIVKSITRLIKGIKDNNGKLEVGVVVFNFLLLLALLLLVWPGEWSWDDVYILYGTPIYELTPWQHIFSGLFQILCLETIPFNSGVIIIQIIISSLIVGYVANKLLSILNFKKSITKYIFVVLLIIVCNSLPVVEYILSGFRMGIYSFIELLLITKLFVTYYDKEKINNCDFIQIILLTVIIACWRSEAIYYCLAVPVILLFMGRKIISIKRVVIALAIITVLTLGIGRVNNSMIGTNDYSITATIAPLSDIVKHIKKNNIKYDFSTLDKVIDTDMIKTDDDAFGEWYYWNGIVKKDYTDEDYSRFMKEYANLLIKYPDVAVNTMWDMFYKTSGLKVEDGYTKIRSTTTNQGTNALDLFDSDLMNSYMWDNMNSPLKNPINKELRKKALRAISCIDKNQKVTPLYYVEWNLFIPIVLMIAMILASLIRKDFVNALIGLTILARVVLVFATASAPYFMYYLSVYLTGYVYSLFLIFNYNKNKSLKKNKKTKRIKKRVLCQIVLVDNKFDK